MKLCLLTFFSLMLSFPLMAQTSNWSSFSPETVFVKGGTFTMGSNSGSAQARPAHLVTLSDFYIGKYEVTVAQYRAFCEDLGRPMPEEPEWGWNDRHPIVNVSYNDAVAFCKWLSDKFMGTWRLPTEAEWEYAAKGGVKAGFSYFAGSVSPDLVSWHSGNSGGKTHEVGGKKPNELGIYDMSGNVFEWCSDWYGDYPARAQKNPPGPSSGSYRVGRGGSFAREFILGNVENRGGAEPFEKTYEIGFRVVFVL